MRRKTGRERFETKKRISTIERQIDKFNTEILELSEQLHKITNWQEAAKLGELIQQIHDKKDDAEEEWLELHDKLEELTSD